MDAASAADAALPGVPGAVASLQPAVARRPTGCRCRCNRDATAGDATPAEVIARREAAGKPASTVVRSGSGSTR